MNESMGRRYFKASAIGCADEGGASIEYTLMRFVASAHPINWCVGDSCSTLSCLKLLT